LGPFLLAVLYPRVKRGQLLYRDILRRPPPARTRRRFGLLLVTIATGSGMVLGNLLSSGALHVPFLATAAAANGTGAAAVGLGLLPVWLLLLVGVALL